MKGKIFRIATILLILLAPLFVLTLPCFAIADPDTSPSVSNIYANTFLYTSGDVLIYGEYNIPYASPPTVPVSNTFIIQLLDTDNTTELGAVIPYTFFGTNRGYNHGGFSFYFNSLTWNKQYIIRISENPAYFPSPKSWETAMPLAAYTSMTTQDENQDELTVNLINMAHNLENYYTSYKLLETSAGSTVLSTTGEIYFRGIIPGIQAMAPSLFLVQTMTMDASSINWTTEQFDTYNKRFGSTWVETSENATATQFGMSTSMVMCLLIIMPLCIGSCILSSWKFRRVEAGLMVSAVFLIMGGLMYWIAAPLFAIIFQLFGIYTAYVLFH